MERPTCEEQGLPAKQIVRVKPDWGRNPGFPQETIKVIK